MYTVCVKKKFPLTDGIRELLHTMSVHDVQLLGISEHQLSTASFRTKQKLFDSFRMASNPAPGAVTYQFNSSAESPPTETQKMMGGTGLIHTQSLVGRIEPKGRGGDAMGRWSFVHLRRANHLAPLTIVSVYQVCKKPTNTIGYTAWHQQRRALDMDERYATHPREAFLEDLLQFVRQLQSQGHDVILGGDWNDSMSMARSSLQRLCSQLDLYIHLS